MHFANTKHHACHSVVEAKPEYIMSKPSNPSILPFAERPTFHTGLFSTPTLIEVSAKEIYIPGHSEYRNIIIYLNLITCKLPS